MATWFSCLICVIVLIGSVTIETTALSPESARYRDIMENANKFFYEGNYSEALYFYDMATKLSPEDPASWYNEGVVLFKLAKYDEAYMAFQKSLELDPNNKNKDIILVALNYIKASNATLAKAEGLGNQSRNVLQE
jgi:tetratricopeptide (TPR) repeat protein